MNLFFLMCALYQKPWDCINNAVSICSNPSDPPWRHRFVGIGSCDKPLLHQRRHVATREMDAAPDADRLPQRRRTHGPVGKEFKYPLCNLFASARKPDSDFFRNVQLRIRLCAERRSAASSTAISLLRLAGLQNLAHRLAHRRLVAPPDHLPPAASVHEGIPGPGLPVATGRSRKAAPAVVFRTLRNPRLPCVDVDVRGRPPHRRPFRGVVTLVVPAFKHRPAVLTAPVEGHREMLLERPHEL